MLKFIYKQIGNLVLSEQVRAGFVSFFFITTCHWFSLQISYFLFYCLKQRLFTSILKQTFSAIVRKKKDFLKGKIIHEERKSTKFSNKHCGIALIKWQHFVLALNGECFTSKKMFIIIIIIAILIGDSIIQIKQPAAGWCF